MVPAIPVPGTPRVLVRKGGAEFLCERCGARITLALPMPVYTWARKAKAFEALHTDCVAPSLPPGAPPEAD
jgi:hypothetical protein